MDEEDFVSHIRTGNAMNASLRTLSFSLSFSERRFAAPFAGRKRERKGAKSARAFASSGRFQS